MLEKPIVKRIFVAKLVGFVIGLFGFAFLPDFYPEATLRLRWGVLLWYTTLGAVIGVFGIFKNHPVFKFPMPWFFRGTVLGAWMNFVLVLFAYDIMADVIAYVIGSDTPFSSPYIFVLEGAIIGFVIGFFATKYGGEGKALME